MLMLKNFPSMIGGDVSISTYSNRPEINDLKEPEAVQNNFGFLCKSNLISIVMMSLRVIALLCRLISPIG